MNSKIESLMTELKTELKAIYSDRLKGVYLYGSYARGEQDAESDVDVLVVLNRIDHYAAEVDRTGQLGADLSLKDNVSVSMVFMPETTWLHGDTAFLANVREEALAA